VEASIVGCVSPQFYWVSQTTPPGVSGSGMQRVSPTPCARLMYWINRVGISADELGVSPVATLPSLSPLLAAIAGGG